MKIGNRFKEYVLTKYLGKGTHGEVWLAEKDKKHYALKFLKSENFDKTRFDKEVEVLKKVKGHKNILTIQDSFTDQGKYIIVTDYANGGSLEDRKTRINSNEALKIITQVLDGVSWLHEIPINHRDIKPGNILLKNKIPCLADFGLARDLNRTQSTSHIEGTKPYFSPELADAYTKQNPNKKLTYKRTIHDDLWAVATTFYFILIKKFPCGSLAERTIRVPLPKNFPQDLIPFFDKAFQEQQTDRFQSAEAMAEFLESIRQERVIEQRTTIIKKELGAEFEKKLEEEKAKHQREKQILLEQVVVLKSEIEKKNFEIKNFQETLELFEEEVTNLEKEKKALEGELEKKAVELKKLQKEKKFLESKVEEKNVEIKSLKEVEKQSKEKIKSLEKENKSLSEDVFSLLTKNEILVEVNSNLQKQVEARDIDINRLKNLLGIEKDKNNQLESQLFEKDEKIKELNKKVLGFSRENEKQKIKINQLEKSLGEKVSKVESVTTVNKQLHEEKRVLEKSLTELVTRTMDYAKNQHRATKRLVFTNKKNQEFKDFNNKINNVLGLVLTSFEGEKIVYKLQNAVTEISHKSTVPEILKMLVNHAEAFAPRGAFFIIKKKHFVGWRTFGKSKSENDDVIRTISFPVVNETILGNSIRKKTTQISAFPKGEDISLYLDAIGFEKPSNQIAIPFIVNGQETAVLYADGADINVEALEILVRIASLTVELLPSSRGKITKQSQVSLPIIPTDDYKFEINNFDMPKVENVVTPTKPRTNNRDAELPIEVSEDERHLHNAARRFARLLVSEVKLDNEQEVKEGCESKDLYTRLKGKIDQSREMYDKKVQPPVTAKFDYFHYELVNTLAKGDESKLGLGAFCKTCSTKLDETNKESRFCQICGTLHQHVW